MKPTISEYIQQWTKFEEPRLKESTHANIFTGRTDKDFFALAPSQPGGGIEVSNWANATYTRVKVYPKDLATITYAEGDILVVVCRDRESFLRELLDCFYFSEHQQMRLDPTAFQVPETAEDREAWIQALINPSREFGHMCIPNLDPPFYVDLSKLQSLSPC